MYWLVALMSFAILGLIVSGILLEWRPRFVSRIRPWCKPALGTQLAVFIGAQFALLLLGIQDAFANPEDVAAVAGEMSVGMGLAIIGVGIPTGLSTIGAGIAVGPIGAASLAAITEKPENLGRTLIYLGLAEGIAIYGLVISILLLNKI
ncbi:ATP synthase subunit C [Thiobaca trueperi]|uniref:V/A-type H+-transporting ATPase subunit K n=1 Tax=Thiobaca trueperi TaxID=127458 RepID=A0A4R3NA27_9GAMM|nr:ATP synthase subunit C [Thiobaca trueperi]TCT23849.1 V/A-type H+-transporting ATPase subunit K [Thiobaca trueperi]